MGCGLDFGPYRLVFSLLFPRARSWAGFFSLHACSVARVHAHREKENTLARLFAWHCTPALAAFFFSTCMFVCMTLYSRALHAFSTHVLHAFSTCVLHVFLPQEPSTHHATAGWSVLLGCGCEVAFCLGSHRVVNTQGQMSPTFANNSKTTCLVELAARPERPPFPYRREYSLTPVKGERLDGCYRLLFGL
jgi:hypothetical protein